LRILSGLPSDAQEAGSLGYKPQGIHIYSNSWGPSDDGSRKEGPGKLTLAAMEKGIKEGRNGKGSIYVWAAGNGRSAGDNCNYDGYVNKRYTISIPAVDFKGVQAYYSEDCAMHVVAAPSSGSARAISTTARGGQCTSSFGGTSAAAPLVAGVVALILEANPELTWRDMIAVLLSTADRNHQEDSGWWKNGAGYYYSHKYGFGVVNAHAAVLAAKSWKYLSPGIF
jgi:subtilisin family serine protease